MIPRSHYHRHRYPIDVISQCVWLYFRFSLSYRDVELMMAERGVVVSYETVRAWCSKFGREYAKRLRRNRGRLADTWHLDEMYLKIDGNFQYLWRAVNQEGQVVDILVQSRRDTSAAKRFFSKLLGKEYAVRTQVITDRQGSWGAAMRLLIPKVNHIQNKGANSRAEISHQPTRQRERRRCRFRTASEAQKFLSTFSAVSNKFREERHLIKVSTHHVYYQFDIRSARGASSI